MASALYLPNTNRDEYDEDAYKGFVSAASTRAWLKEYDDLLDLVYARPEAKPPLQGGFWHIVRRNENGSTSFWVVQNPDGSFTEPDMRHVEMMQRIDGWRDPGGGLREVRTARERKRRAEIEATNRKHEEFRERLLERLESALDKDSRIWVPSRYKDALTDQAIIAAHMDEEARTAPSEPTPEPVATDGPACDTSSESG